MVFKLRRHWTLRICPGGRGTVSYSCPRSDTKFVRTPAHFKGISVSLLQAGILKTCLTPGINYFADGHSEFNYLKRKYGSTRAIAHPLHDY